MKKCIAMILTLCLALTAVCCASAETIVSQPAVCDPENDGYTAVVDVENGFKDNNITFEYYLNDMYKTDELAALKAGDVIKAWDKEYTVETVEPEYYYGEVLRYHINGGFMEGGLSFSVSETDANLCYCMGYDYFSARTEAGEVTLPMAEEVTVTVYVLEENGTFNGAVEEVVMPAGEVQSYLLARANTGDDTAIILDTYFTIYEEEGVVVEIGVEWTPKNDLLLPKHSVSMDDYGTSECTVSAHFDTAADIDDQNRLTYAVRLEDLYDPEQVLALQPGDRFVAFDQEMTVETIQMEDDMVCINGEGGVYFRREGDMMVCCDYTEEVSCKEAGTYTFPLSNPVKVVTFSMDENGAATGGMDEHLFTPDEAKAFFEEHSDFYSPFYISAFGSATTVSVKNGEVTEIVINWSSDS